MSENKWTSRVAPDGVLEILPPQATLDKWADDSQRGREAVAVACILLFLVGLPIPVHLPPDPAQLAATGTLVI
jgi:hypothetical protein